MAMLPMRRFLPKDPYHLILFALPWLLLVLNINWPFGNGGNCDPWFYWGHFHAFPQLHFWNPYYYEERLALILPGLLFHHLFTPPTAPVLLHTSFFYVAIYSLYYITRTIRDRHTALLIATLMACHSFFIGAMSWDYIDGFGIAYYLLTIAFLTRGLQGGRPQPWIALAGAAWGACFYTNPIWIILLAFFPVYYLVPSYKQGTETLCSGMLTFCKFFCAGFAGLSVMLGAVNYVAIGKFWFYSQSLAIGSSLNAFPEWHGQSFAWLARATWMVYPALTFVAVLMYVFRAVLLRTFAYFAPNRFGCREPAEVLALLLLVNFLYCCFALFYLTFIVKHRVLEFDFYANLLIAPMFLALGSEILTVPRIVDLPRFLKIVASAGIIAALPLWMRVRYTDLVFLLPFVRQHSHLVKYYLVLPCVIGSVALLLPVLWPRAFSAWRLSVLAFAVAGFGLVPEYTGSIWLSGYRGPAMYARIAHACDIIRMHTDLQRPPFSWFDARERNVVDYYSICRSLRGNQLVDLTFPCLSPAAVIPPDSLILILTEDKHIPSTAQQALRQVGLLGELESQVRIADSHTGYWITFMRARKAEPAALAARR